jgi:hypothetical protein
LAQRSEVDHGEEASEEVEGEEVEDKSKKSEAGRPGAQEEEKSSEEERGPQTGREEESQEAVSAAEGEGCGSCAGSGPRAGTGTRTDARDGIILFGVRKRRQLSRRPGICKPLAACVAGGFLVCRIFELQEPVVRRSVTTVDALIRVADP